MNEDIKRKVERAKRLIQKHEKALREIQETCEHPNYEAEYKSNTGNFCKEDDSYWIECKCLDCDKRLRFESTEDGYKKFEPK